MAAGGVPALARVVSSEQQLPRAIRFVMAAIEALMLACPAASCEALLGWWRPTTDEAEQDLQSFRQASEADGVPANNHIKVLPYLLAKDTAEVCDMLCWIAPLPQHFNFTSTSDFNGL